MSNPYDVPDRNPDDDPDIDARREYEEDEYYRGGDWAFDEWLDA
jgi:hypothetical protein